MNWFKNLKIRVKLISSFLLVAFIAGLIGIIAMTNIKTLDNRDTFLYEKTTLAIVYLSNISDAFQKMRSCYRDVMLSKTQEEIDKYCETIKKLNDITHTESKNYEKTFIDDNDKINHELLNKYYASFYEDVNKFLDLIKQNKKDEAYQFLRGPFFKTTGSYGDHIAKMIDDNAATAKQTSDENTEMANAVNRTMIIIIVLGVLISILLGLFISRIISNPVKKLEQLAIKVSEGNLNVTVDINTKDELGSLANAFQLLITNFKNLLSKVIEKTEIINKESEELSSISTVAASASGELQAQAQTASSSSEQISANVTTVASSAEEMTASIKEISKNTTSASSLTKESEERANDASKVMNRLGNSSQEIGNIVKSITTIAEQTNLLALNATIEAARAGELGKGFAVVANEVKELAKEAAKATEDITNKIKIVQDDTMNAVQVINGIIENASKVNMVTNSIASAIEEQSVTTTEINRNLAEATRGVQSIVEVITGISSAANDYSKQAITIKSTSGSLKSMSNELEKEIKTNFRF